MVPPTTPHPPFNKRGSEAQRGRATPRGPMALTGLAGRARVLGGLGLSLHGVPGGLGLSLELGTPSAPAFTAPTPTAPRRSRGVPTTLIKHQG